MSRRCWSYEEWTARFPDLMDVGPKKFGAIWRRKVEVRDLHEGWWRVEIYPDVESQAWMAALVNELGTVDVLNGYRTKYGARMAARRRWRKGGPR